MALRWVLVALLVANLLVVNAAVFVALGFGGACPGPGERIVVVDGAELEAAIEVAEPGTIIELRPGAYRGRFELVTDGTAREPITLCGPGTAVLDGGDPESGYGLHVMADHWVIRGLTVANALKGIVMDGSNHVAIVEVEVRDIGTEAIRLRDLSTANVIQRSRILNTGTSVPENGEGVYLGTANSQWCDRLACIPDASDQNLVVANTIGPGVAAESVDIKEGSVGGVIRANTFIGDGMYGADSWIDVKGNEYLVTGNHGIGSARDGIQIHGPVLGWGARNRIENNLMEVNASGHGIWVGDSALAGQNILGCSNVIQGAEAGDMNLPCR